VPANVDIYATMNTQDHSLAPLDMALRRRFRFVDCPPQPELLPTISLSKETDTGNAADATAATIDLAKLLMGLNHRITQSLGADVQLGHAFFWSVNSLEQLQSVLVEQIIPQLAQAAGGQVAVLQYIFNDESQPMCAQFIHDNQALINNDPSSQMDNQNNIAGQNQMFSGHGAFLGQAMNAGSYRINTDLIAKTGEFIKPFVYQRLYE
jgi:5-methylcytosine-specific restriction protein B